MDTIINQEEVRHRWLTPIIIATQQAEIRRTRFEVSLGIIV
jgi:hypothetical protein